MAAQVDVPILRDPPDVRDARRWQYLTILVQATGVDAAEVPDGQMPFALVSPFERLGYTEQDIENWIDACDPAIKPAWDEVACFRAKVQAVLKPKASLGTLVLVLGGAAFLGAFALTRASR